MSTDAPETVRSDLEDEYNRYYQGWQNYLREAVTDMEMHLGAQFTGAEQEYAQQNDRTLYAFGKSTRQVSLLSGYEIRNRHLLKIGPVGREDDNACRQHTSLLAWQMSLFFGYEQLSEAFKWGSLVTGSNLFEFWRDRQGLIRFGRRSFNSFLLDPNLSQPDLSDCDGILCGRWLPDAQVKALLPDRTEDIDAIHQTESSPRWNRAPHMTKARRDDSRLYEEWYRRDTRLVPTVVSRMSGAEFQEEAVKSLKQMQDKGQIKAVAQLPENSGSTWLGGASWSSLSLV